MESVHHYAQVQARTAECPWKVRCQRVGVTASQYPPPTISILGWFSLWGGNALLPVILLFSLLAGTSEVKSAGKTTPQEEMAAPVLVLSLSSAAQAPWAHLTRSWQLPPGSAQQCSASSITFSWKWSFPFLWGRIMQSHWGGTTTTRLAGTKPRALYKVWVLFWAPSQSPCLLQANPFLL